VLQFCVQRVEKICQLKKIKSRSSNSKQVVEDVDVVGNREEAFLCQLRGRSVFHIGTPTMHCANVQGCASKNNHLEEFHIQNVVLQIHN